MAEHQFSDLEDSDSESDLDEDEDEDEEESQDEPSGLLEADSLPGQGPGPRDTYSGSQASQASSVSEGPAAGSGSVSDLPHLAPTPASPLEKDSGSAPSTKTESPRRPWSPSKESASRPLLAHKHSLCRSDLSPQPRSPAQEPPPSTPSPLGPHPGGSPRLELSPLSPQPPGRDSPPRVDLHPELKGSTDPVPNRHSPTRNWSPGQGKPLPWSALPGKWTSAGERGPGSGLAPRALIRPTPLPHKLLSRSPETCSSTWVSSHCPGYSSQLSGISWGPVWVSSLEICVPGAKQPCQLLSP